MNARLAFALAGLLPIAPRPAFSLQLLSREDPRVDTANNAYAAGKYDEALKGYEDALREHPNAPELQFDRGNALFKLGREGEAREAYLSALAARDGSLKSQDYYNMGNALWGLDKKDEAAEAYQRALLIDPSFDDARHNLELLLAPPPDAGQPDGGGQDGGGQDGGGQDGGQDGGQPKGDGGSDGGSKAPKGGGDGGADAGANQDGGSPPPQSEHRPDAGSEAKPQPQPLDKLKSEQLLDALRQREKNLQMWKFRLKQQQPKDTEKDW